MGSLDTILRRSSMVDTSGSYPAGGIQISAITAGGVYPQIMGDSGSLEGTAQGRLSLGIIGGFILGALVFYWWTNTIQGGG